MIKAFDEFAAQVRDRSPRLAVVLGSGLGAVPHQFDELASIVFADVPGLAAPSVHGHSGRIAFGLCAGEPLLVFRGRLHFYESHSWDAVAGPIRLVAELEARTLLLTNAAGGIHDDLIPGDLMVLNGHLFLQDGERLESEPRRPYSPGLIDAIRACSPMRAGVYAAVTGPCYETPAEIRAFRAMGADAVGMSTAYEAETAVRLGLEVAAISCITNKAAGLAVGTLNHAEVLANASKPAERISAIMENLVTFAKVSG